MVIVQYPATLFSLNSTGGNTRFFVSDISYWPTGSKFQGSGSWDINGIEWPVDPFSDAYWNGAKPNCITFSRFGNGAGKMPYTKTLPKWEINGINY